MCVSQASFYAWRRKLRHAPNFAEVRVASEPAGPSAAAGDAGALEVHLAGGRRIVVRAGFDRPTLLELVATLESGIAGNAGDAGRSRARDPPAQCRQVRRIVGRDEQVGGVPITG